MEELFEMHSKKDLPWTTQNLESSLMKLKTLLQKLFDAQQYDFDNIKLQEGKQRFLCFARNCPWFWWTKSISLVRKFFKKCTSESHSLWILMRLKFVRCFTTLFFWKCSSFCSQRKWTYIYIYIYMVELLLKRNRTVFCFPFKYHDEEFRKRSKRIFKNLKPEKHQKEEEWGLGFTSVKKIVQLHKGSIWAENAPGGGTLFLFSSSL